MSKITVNAYGKINLSLDVLRRRPDGYHEVKMVMQQINLKDIVTIEEINEEMVLIESNNPNVPTDSSNLVYKAWKLLSQRFGIKKGIRINIEKNIPMAAGLAGGSSNAAAVLKGLNTLWDLKLNQQELMDLGLNIGADVPYCILGGTALAEGIGENLTKLPSFKDKHVLLANPGISVSTAYVYQNLDLKRINKHPNTEELIKAIKEDDMNLLSNNMVNLLETVTIKEHSIINEIKSTMIQHGAFGSLMSGSGPTVFGLFNDKKALSKCMEKLKQFVDIVIYAKTC